MMELATSAGLPAPEIEDAGGCVTVRFRLGQYVPPRRVEREVTERQRTILALLAEAPDGLALREIVPQLGQAVTARQIRDDLATLRTLGLAISEGHGRGSRWKRRETRCGGLFRLIPSIWSLLSHNMALKSTGYMDSVYFGLFGLFRPIPAYFTNLELNLDHMILKSIGYTSPVYSGLFRLIQSPGPCFVPHPVRRS